jgi:hypothetical protein
MQVAKAKKEKNNRKKKKKVFKTAGIYIMKADIYIYNKRKKKKEKEKRKKKTKRYCQGICLWNMINPQVAGVKKKKKDLIY